MTQELQWRLILVHLGWRCLQACHTENGLVMYGDHPTPEGCEKSHRREECPRFLSDLNAMAEIESSLNGQDFARYISRLESVVGEGANPCHNAVCATAAQRAEAFLRAIGCWEESA